MGGWGLGTCDALVCVCSLGVNGHGGQGFFEYTHGVCGILLARVYIWENGLGCGTPEWRVGK